MKDLILMTGIGSYLPKNKVSNNDLSAYVDTSDEWIQQRTGIKFRHFVGKNELTSDMATKASIDALNYSKLNSNDIDLIVLATTTPDNSFPSTASKVQKNLKTKAIAFDIQAVCAGFIYALSVATSMLRNNFGKKCLVIGADSMSKILNWKDRTTSVLFGDGAGAVVLEKYTLKQEFYNKDIKWGVLSNYLQTDGELYDILYTDGGISLNQSSGHIKMIGKDVFKHAVEKLSNSFLSSLNEAKLSINDIDWLVPHQANQRIINSVANKLNVDFKKIISTVSYHGNTSAASIPLALNVGLKDQRIKNSHVLGLQAIGGGLAWGSSIVKFGKPDDLKEICL